MAEKREGYLSEFLVAGTLVSEMARFYGNPDAQTLSTGCRIDDFVVISGKVKLGAYVHIGPGCSLHGGGMGITIEDGVAISAGTRIFATSDNYGAKGLFGPEIASELKGKPVDRPVKICRHSIIGANSVILPGTLIGEHCAFGALSVVKGGIYNPQTVYAGQPARAIGSRDVKANTELARRFEELYG